MLIACPPTSSVVNTAVIDRAPGTPVPVSAATAAPATRHTWTRTSKRPNAVKRCWPWSTPR